MCRAFVGHADATTKEPNGTMGILSCNEGKSGYAYIETDISIELKFNKATSIAELHVDFQDPRIKDVSVEEVEVSIE